MEESKRILKKHKKKSKKEPNSSGGKRKNPRAFSVANVVRTKRTQQRNLDKAQQKELIPLVNREEELPPPALVVIMGPKGVGKTTLIRSLVKMYTGQNITDTVGPITVVAGKKRRVTFFECPLDIMSMTDLSKVADLVLLMIDASYGFEMETFEFLNQLQLHGFPKVMGVMTHFDKFRANKTLQATKKGLKHRFWTEIYKGAKMFEFMGVVNGKYRKHEVKRLSLYISRVKFRPLIWRNTHPYVVVDRIEDVTSSMKLTQHGSICDRDVVLYGYVRGSHMKSSMKLHLIGAGDFDIAHISSLPDPCPLPGGHVDSINSSSKKTLKSKKDSLLYAPLANIGRVSMDKDGTYIEIKNVHYTKKDQLHFADIHQHSNSDNNHNNYDNNNNSGNTPMDLLRSMQDVKVSVDKQLKSSRGLSLFANSEEQYDDYNQVTDDDEEEEENDDVEDNDNNEVDEDVNDEDGDEYDEEEEDDEESQELYDNYDDENEDEGAENSEEDSEDHHKDLFNKAAKNASNSSKVLVSSSKSNNNSGKGSEKLSLTYKPDFSKFTEDQRDIMKLVYGNNWNSTSSSNNNNNNKFSDVQDNDNEDNDSDDDLFALKSDGQFSTKKMKEKQLYDANNAIDSSRSNVFINQNNNKKLSSNSNITKVDPNNIDELWLERMKTRFVTGGYGDDKIEAKKSKKNKKNNDNDSDNDDSNDDNDGDDDNEEYGDFEDLQTGEVFGADGSKKNNNSKKSDDKKKKSVNNDDEEDDDEDNEDNSDSDNYDDDEEEDGEDDSDNDNDDDEEDEDDEDDNNSEAMEERNEDIDRQLREMNAQKKAKFKESFDNQYDSKKGGDDEDAPIKGEDKEEEKYLEEARLRAEELRERNKREFGEDGEFIRQQHEGFRQGLYVRILIQNVPQEFTTNFRPYLPVILGGLLPHENAMGFITARVKRHRWHKRVLKSNDPLIFSIGWRRFQSIPVYTTEDQNTRERFLKYTPEHMHCTATFYGPLVPPNTGILAFQKTSNVTTDFRISLTGTTLEQRATPNCVKKLKLVGTPLKVYKNSAFITGMFNSALEVAKFEHAKIKTVSGIRGSIKKAIRSGNGGGPPGTFRATFEDKILMSDIVICRLWVPIEFKEYYNPVLSLLENDNDNDNSNNNNNNNGDVMEVEDDEYDVDDEGDDNDNNENSKKKVAKDLKNPINEELKAKSQLGMMRTTSEIRKSEKIAMTVNKDSVYKPIQRTPREFKKLQISNKLQESLPYASKPKQQMSSNREGYLARRAVILEPTERKARGLVQMLSTIRKDKLEKRQISHEKRQTEKNKIRQRETERFDDYHKEEKKRKYREKGKEDAHRAAKKAKQQQNH